MTTCDEPVLILWSWIGEDLDFVPILWSEDQDLIQEGASLENLKFNRIPTSDVGILYNELYGL
mgnify:CR=1 FL=1